MGQCTADTISVCILTPIYSAREVENARAVETLRYECGWQVLEEVPGNPIHSARSRLANRYLRDTDAAWSLWIDADMIFDPRDAVRLVAGAVAYGADLYAAYYPERRPGGQLVGRSIVGGVTLGKDKRAVPMLQAGCGFLAVRRSAWQRMADGMPELALGGGVTGAHFFADTIRPAEGGGPDELVSEDIGLCVRARAAGLMCLLDPSIRIGHRGSCTYWPGGEW
jgi:hypothetical protein